MIDKEKQFMDQYDKYLKQQTKIVGLVNSTMPDTDTSSLQEVIAVLDTELDKIR